MYSMKHAITALWNLGAIHVAKVRDIEDSNGKAKPGAKPVALAASFDVADTLEIPEIAGASVEDILMDFPRIGGSNNLIKIRVVVAVMSGIPDRARLRQSALDRLMNMPPSWGTVEQRLESRRRSLLTLDAAIRELKRIDGYVWSTTRKRVGVTEFGALFKRTGNLKVPEVDGLTVRQFPFVKHMPFNADGDTRAEVHGILVIGEGNGPSPDKSMRRHVEELIDKKCIYQDLV